MIEIAWLAHPAAVPNEAARRAAEMRQRDLTKPPGALGRLESAAIQLAALQGTATPTLERVHVTVYAADHGVACEGVSAFPQAVTAQMVRNFARGGAAINVLARAIGATLEVIDLGTVAGDSIDGVVTRRLGHGTANFTIAPALNESQLKQALAIGADAASRARAAGAQLYIGGEMGIGNTAAATAIACALLRLEPERLCGPGAGLSAAGVAHKAGVIRRALARHADAGATPLGTLRCLGGFEIAALAGAYVACAQLGLPALVDGFIATSAALAAVQLNPSIAPWLLYAHASAEPGHRAMLSALAATPLLDLEMRLGEGTGAAVAVPLLRMACALHAGMATFAEAGVATEVSR